MDLKDKKLLILGSNAITCSIVEAAKALGVYTIVTSWNKLKDAPAKQIADKYWDISLTDYDALLKAMREESVDGILTGFTDSYLLPYQHLCKLSNLPCYATKEVFEMTMDKAMFKQLCRENGVPIIPEYKMETFNPASINEKNKVIIKPVDNSGSRGVILCEKPEDYQKCIEYALSFSEKKQVVIEKYMDMDSISLSYTIQNGILSLSTTDDRYVHKSSHGGAVTNISIYPSKYTSAYIKKVDPLVKKMYQKAGVKNGVIAVQFFTDGENFYVMEMGHRLTGGQHYTYTMKENGISVLDCLIHFALTGEMANYAIAEKDNAEFKNTYCHLIILGKQAKIARFEGIDYVQNMPELIHLTQMKKVGEMIGADGTSAQKVIGLHLKIRDRVHLQNVFIDIKRHLHIYDEDGNDITMDFNSNIL